MRPLLHYCWVSPRAGARWKMPLSAYICIASALRHIRPRRTVIWTDAIPCGEHWKRLEGDVDVQPVRSDLTAWGTKPLLLGAHKADKARLEVILRHGGIYLDLDVLVLRPFEDLFGERLVMGRVSRDGLGNAVIIARPRDPFLSEWRNSFEDHFDPFGWDEASVKLPHRLARRHPHWIRVLPATAFYYPSWPDWRRVFDEKEVLLPQSYAYHLWNLLAKDHLDGLTRGRILRGSSHFDRIAREYL